MHRRFRMAVYPADGGYFLVVNSLLVEVEHAEPPLPSGPSSYESEGLITMCAHCRKTLHADEERWDWVPAHLDRAYGAVSHGLARRARSSTTAR